MLRRNTLLAILAIFALVVTGCSGEDGATGPAGPEGEPGSPQPIKVLVAGPALTGALENIIIQATRLEVFPIGTELNYMYLNGLLPELSALKEYDVVFLHTDYSAYEADSLGDILAEYVDDGGGLVMTQFCFSSNYGIGGEIMTSGYSPLQPADAAGSSGDRQIDPSSVSIPIHPIFNGADVENLTYWAIPNFSDPPLDSGATLLATDLGGANAIAINADGNIIALNMFANSLNETYYSSAKVMANSCLFVAEAF